MLPPPPSTLSIPLILLNIPPDPTSSSPLLLNRHFGPTHRHDHPLVPTSLVSILEMLKEGHTLHLDGPIFLSLRPIFLSSISTDASSSTRRGDDTSFGSNGGDDDASSSSQRDTDDDSIG